MKRFQPSTMMQRLPEQFFSKLTRTAAEMSAAGHDLINLGQGSPDLPTPPHIVEALKKGAEHPAYHRYTPFRGLRVAKEAMATFYEQQYGVRLNPETEVALLIGGKVGLVEISQCLLDPTDTALVPDPGYPDYWSGIAIAGARMETMPLTEQNDFLPDYSQLSTHTLDSSKLMFLNYPNNPTAAVATPAFFEETVALAETHDICVLHDFAYGAIGYDGDRPISFLETPGAMDVGLELYTLSKTYNMAGWRVAFAVGNEQLIEHMNVIQDHYHCGMFGAMQEAAAAALLGNQDCVHELRSTYEHRRNTFIDALHAIGWNGQAPKGSFYTWLPIPEGYTSAAFADRLLHDAHVVTAPGIGFGSGGEGYVRAALVTNEERLQEAVERVHQLRIWE